MKASTKKLIEGVFLEYPGSVVVDALQDGACIEGWIDGEHFSLEKVEGEMVFSEERMGPPDFEVELNAAACKYITESEEPEEYVTRVRECIRGEHDGCFMNYAVTAPVTQLLTKGYMEFARKMGILPRGFSWF